MRSDQAKHEQPLRRLWWLHPAWLFAAVVGGTMCVAYLQQDDQFRLYGAPKFLTEKHMLLAALAIAAFAIGQRLSSTTGRIPAPTTDADRTVRFWLWLTTGLTLFGYAIWFVIGVKNGFSIGSLREFLTTDDPLVAESIRDDIFINLKGVTTCTQFGIAAVPLGLWLFFRGERWTVWPIGLVVLLAAARALVFSERLALVELALPAIVIALRARVLGKPMPAAIRGGLQLLPLGGVAALLLFFGAFEYFRSWRFYRDDFDSYAQFTVWRVTGYYTTAHNNSAMALETQPAYPLPYATLRPFWSIPGLANTPLGYARLTGVDPTARHLAMLERYGTPELNNEGGLFQPALDFGLAGYVVFWFASGFVAGRAYRSFLGGTLAGIAFYPLIVLAILETPRFLYLCYPRSLPATLALLCVCLMARGVAEESPQPAAATA